MPKEYEHCKESYIKKGTSEKKAKEICAGMYYNRHKMTVKEAHKRGIKSMKENYIYVARTKEALKGYLEIYNLNPNKYVIIPIQEPIRKNEKVKSLVPKIENDDYKYMMVHKSVVEVTTDAKLVLKLDKIKENETSKQNTDNEPEVEQVNGIVKDGKVKSMHTQKDKKVVTKAEEQPLEEDEKRVMQEALNHLLDCVQEGKLTSTDKEILSKMMDVASGKAEVSELETLMSSARTEEASDEMSEDEDELPDMGMTSEESTTGTTDTTGGEFIPLPAETGDELGMQEPMVEPEVEGEKLEEKTMNAAGNSAQSLEKEDLEKKEKEDEDKESLRKMLKAHNSLDDEVPVFMEKHQAIKFLREYQNRTKSRAMIIPAGNKYQKIFGSKAKYVVEIDE